MGKFEDDLKRVRIEEKAKPFDWFSFIEIDADKAIRKFIKANKREITINWNARTYSISQQMRNAPKSKEEFTEQN